MIFFFSLVCYYSKEFIFSISDSKIQKYSVKDSKMNQSSLSNFQSWNLINLTFFITKIFSFLAFNFSHMSWQHLHIFILDFESLKNLFPVLKFWLFVSFSKLVFAFLILQENYKNLQSSLMPGLFVSHINQLIFKNFQCITILFYPQFI